MTSWFDGDASPPDAKELTRVVLARAAARLAVSHAIDVHEAILWTLFRNEIGAAVRRVSPVLVAVLDREALPLDEVAWSIAPGFGWPFHPLHGTRVATTGRRWTDSRRKRPLRARLSSAGMVLGMREGGRMRVEVEDGGIEVSGRCGSVGVVTRGAVVRLTVPGTVPTAVARAAIGRPASSLVDLEILRGRDWTVVAVETRRPTGGSTFVVETGSRPYVLPWVRAP